MDVSYFIARRLRFKGRMAVISIAVSFLVMIIAVSVSSGFRHEIRNGLAAISGDVQLAPPDLNVMDSSQPVESNPSYLDKVISTEGVDRVIPVVYRAGIVKNDNEIYGVLFKAVPEGQEAVSGVHVPDSIALQVAVPRRMSEISGIKPGDRMLTYFIGEKIILRQFNVVSVYDPLVETDDRMVVYASLTDMQRVNGWNSSQVSAMEIMLDAAHKDEESIRLATEEIGTYVNAYSSESEAPVIAVSSVYRFPVLYDWLDVLDFNVFFILLLMTIVAGFNMISGLLIMLFENISTIGLLKSLGMTDRSISKAFLSSSAVLVLKGMAAGNLLALLFCLIQDKTHLITLNPENYFVSFVPVHVDIMSVLLADLTAFVVIMLLLLIPCIFISKVDPAETVRVK
jgi:lipoprotein-releasing system permease protein